MPDGIHRCVEEHARPAPLHHLADESALFRSVAMYLAALARRFPFSELAFVKALACVVGQLLVLRRKM